MLLFELLSLQSSLEKPLFKLFEQQKIVCSRDARMSHSREQRLCAVLNFLRAVSRRKQLLANVSMRNKNEK